MSQTATPRFYVAPFAFDGELQGIGAWQMSALSNRWLDFGRDILRSGGASFGGLLPPPFEHVGLRFTSAHGAALATFSLGGVPVASSAYLRGEDAVAERELLEMFVDSLRRVDAVRQSQTTSQPFAEVFGISERPLHVVVAWGASSEEDSQMIAQLGTHFAGAFLYGRDAVYAPQRPRDHAICEFGLRHSKEALARAVGARALVAIECPRGPGLR